MQWNRFNQWKAAAFALVYSKCGNLHLYSLYNYKISAWKTSAVRKNVRSWRVLMILTNVLFASSLPKWHVKSKPSIHFEGDRSENIWLANRNYHNVLLTGCWTTNVVDMSNPTTLNTFSKWTWIEMVPSPSMSNSWKTSRNSSTCVDKIIWIRQKLKIKANCYHSHGDVIYLKLQSGVLEKKTQVWEIFQGQAPLSIYTSKHKSTRDDKSSVPKAKTE